VHVHQGTAQTDLSSERAYVDSLILQHSKHSHAMRVGQRRHGPDQLVPGKGVFILLASIIHVSEKAYMQSTGDASTARDWRKCEARTLRWQRNASCEMKTRREKRLGAFMRENRLHPLWQTLAMTGMRRG
jgi:hypothetical protein